MLVGITELLRAQIKMKQTAAVINMFALTVLFGGLLLADGRSINEVMKGDITTLYTGPDYAYDNFWIQMYWKDFIVFSVKACTDVHIQLVQERLDQTFNFTELVIGGWYNSKSVFRTGLGNKAHYIDVMTPAILHCAEFRTFWISWAGDTLSSGRGPIPGEQTFIFLGRTGSVAHNINYIGFSTGFGNRGVWQLEENQGYYLFVFTPDDFRYQFMWKTTDYKYKHFTFWVLANHDVHINLTPRAGTIYYEIYIGGYENTKSAMRFGNVERSQYMETGIVSGSEFREFWVSWIDNSIQCGKGGEIGVNRILEWTDPEFAGINHLSVATGYGSNGTWIFNDNLENSFKYNTYNDAANTPQFTQFLTTTRAWTLIEIQACSDAWLVLTTRPEAVDDFSLLIYLGVDNNTKCGARDVFSVVPLVEVPCPALLSCTQPRAIWATWYNGTLRVGQGEIIGVRTLMSADISSYDRYHSSIGFANTHRAGGHYLIRRNAGDSLWMSTAGSDPMGRMLISVAQEVYITFSVKACRNAQIILAGIRGVYDRDAYEAVIGWNGIQTLIRKRVVGSVSDVAIASTPDVISCSESRWFWLGWLDGLLRIGKGQRYGANPLIELFEPMPHVVNYITVGTNAFDGSWEFEGDRGDYLLLDLFNATATKWLYLEPYVTWFYFEITGSEVHLMLSTLFQDLTQVYHIYIGSNVNTQCTLWKQGTLLQTKTQPGLLDAIEPRDFWLSWLGGRFQLGTSKYRGTGVILLDYQDSSPYIITSLGVEAAVSTNRAEVKIWEYTALELLTTTYNVDVPPGHPFQFWRSTRHRSWFMFGLNACARAELALTAIAHTMNPDFSYLIEIQNQNNQTVIWRGLRTKQLVFVDTPNMLSCGVEHHFWLSWLDGHIALGRGRRLGQRSLIAYVDLTPVRITAIAFNSIANEATWRLPLNQDDFPVRRQVFIDPGLSGGDITGVVFGVLLLLGLIAGLGYIVVRQPQPFASFLNPSAENGDAPAASSSRSTSAVSTSSSSAASTSRAATGVGNIVSFSNPLDEFAEVQIKE